MRTSLILLVVSLVGAGGMLYSYYSMQSQQRAALQAVIAKAKASSSSPTVNRSIDPRAFRPKTIDALTAPPMRVPPAAFQVFMAGMSLMLLGGSGLLIRLWGYLSTVRGLKFVRLPLLETRRYRGTLIWAHAIGFGTFLLMMEAAYYVPEMQGEFSAAFSQGTSQGDNIVRTAADIYLRKNIPLAALITVANNFLVATLLTTTLPSLIVPGVGALINWFRFLFVGVLLAPTHVALSTIMLPHSLTALLELEGYILASFFAVLVPVYAFSSRHGPAFGNRYAKSLLLNLQGSAWVFAILLIAAVYEAIEVIAMIP